MRCWVAAEDVVQAELVAHELLDDVVERQVNSDPPRLLVPVLADVEVVGGPTPDDQ